MPEEEEYEGQAEMRTQIVEETVQAFARTRGWGATVPREEALLLSRRAVRTREEALFMRDRMRAAVERIVAMAERSLDAGGSFHMVSAQSMREVKEYAQLTLARTSAGTPRATEASQAERLDGTDEVP